MTDPTHVSEDFRVEQHVKVYLTWDDETGSWYVDRGPTFDGYPLDGLDQPDVDGISRADFTDAERAIYERALTAPLPTGDELVDLLAAHSKPKEPASDYLHVLVTDDGKSTEITCHPTLQAALVALRENYAPDDDVSDEDLVQHVCDQGVVVYFGGCALPLPTTQAEES